MSISKIALAIPLSLGLACSTSGAQAHTGAMWTDSVVPSDGSMPSDAPARGAEAQVSPPPGGGGQDGLALQPTAGSTDASSPAADTSSSPGTSGSSGSMGSSGSSESMGSGSPSGGTMGSGGSSDTMGTEHPGSAGAPDQAQQGAAAGNMGAHTGDQHVMGKISKISKDEISITPKRGEAKTLKINPDTTVSINGKDAKPTQLKQGQAVRASYETVSGEDVAVRIESGKMRHGQAGMKHHKGTDSSGSSNTGASGGSEAGPGGSR